MRLNFGFDAMGAAIVAGIISLIGLVISKEQKVSEFRQAWIDDLRSCMAKYLVNINAFCDAMRLKQSGKDVEDQYILDCLKGLNDANHGIRLRVNESEEVSNKLLASMKRFEDIAKSGRDLTPENIQKIEEEYLSDAKCLLKYEWDRVKRGETAFVIAKGAAIFLPLALIACIFVWRFFFYSPEVSSNGFSVKFLDYLYVLVSG